MITDKERRMLSTYAFYQSLVSFSYLCHLAPLECGFSEAPNNRTKVWETRSGQNGAGFPNYC
jgi:hypothetical protein